MTELGKVQPGSVGCAAFVDVETTGLSPVHHEVLELGVVVFHFDRKTGEILGIRDEYSGFREPSRPIFPHITAINGITDEMVVGKRLNDRRILFLLHSAEFIIAHNARFDFEFVKRLYPAAAQMIWLCSMSQVDWRRHGFASRGLQNLLRAHDLIIQGAHRALPDCKAALALLNCRNPLGDSYFKEILQQVP